MNKFGFTAKNQPNLALDMLQTRLRIIRSAALVSQNMDTPNDITKSCFDTLLAATAADNFEQFISVGDDTFKSGLKPEAFHRVSRALAPRMQKGVTPTFLGELRQSGYIASLWRLRFDDGGDDLLFRMAVANSKVVGALVTPTFS